ATPQLSSSSARPAASSSPHNHPAPPSISPPALHDALPISVGMHIGNHDKRPLDYKMKYAPALDKPDHRTDEYYYANLLDFDGFGITDLGEFHKVARGWKSTHGHIGIRLTQTSGSTALGATVKQDCSIVMGHTHR